MATYGDRVADLDAETEIGLLMQVRGMSREEATALVVRDREARANDALRRANEIAELEQVYRDPKKLGAHPKAARALANTGAQMMRKPTKQDDPHARQGSAAVYATPYRPEMPEGAVPLREAPGFVEHESRLWQGGLRGIAPDEDAEEEARIRHNLNRMRTI